MDMPTTMQIGVTEYRIHYKHKPNKALGMCSYMLGSIEVNTATSPTNMRESLWHEVTHAILKDMEHPQYADEQFVTEFSHRLSKAIDSARF